MANDSHAAPEAAHALAHHAATLAFEALPSRVVRLTKQCILDALGTTIAATTLAPEAPMFMPVQMLGTAGVSGLSHPEPRSSPPSVRPHPGLIEIELGNGSQVRVGNEVNLAALRRVLVALRG